MNFFTLTLVSMAASLAFSIMTDLTADGKIRAGELLEKETNAELERRGSKSRVRYNRTADKLEVHDAVS